MILPDRARFPDFKYTDELGDFLKRILDKNPKTRLGAKNGFREVLSHNWFKGLDINALIDDESRL